MSSRTGDGIFNTRNLSSRIGGSALMDFAGARQRSFNMRKHVLFAEKLPLHLHHIKEITTEIPGTKFLHIIRNPVDTVLSLRRVSMPIRTLGPSVHFDDCIRRWITDIHISLNHANKPNHHLLRYENLVSNSEKNINGFMPSTGRPLRGFNGWSTL